MQASMFSFYVKVVRRIFVFKISRNMQAKFFNSKFFKNKNKNKNRVLKLDAIINL
jgi:hypothetical protein